MLNISYISNKLHTLFFRGYSSAGRASALQAEGHRFDPDRLHQTPNSLLQDEKKRDPASAGQAILSPNFDIVNGFYKSMPWRYRRKG